MDFMSLEEFDLTFFSRYLSPIPTAAGSAKPTVNKYQKISAIFGTGLWVVLSVGILFLVAPRFLGVKYLTVISGSMRPKYNVGCMVLAVPTKFEKIQVGNDVSYVLSTGETSTHRVIGLNRADRTLTVQGIHSSEFAEVVNEVNVIGVVRFHVPKLGGWLENGKFKVAAGIVLAGLIGISFYLSFLGKGEEPGGQIPGRKKLLAAS